MIRWPALVVLALFRMPCQGGPPPPPIGAITIRTCEEAPCPTPEKIRVTRVRLSRPLHWTVIDPSADDLDVVECTTFAQGQPFRVRHASCVRADGMMRSLP